VTESLGAPFGCRAILSMQRARSHEHWLHPQMHSLPLIHFAWSITIALFTSEWRQGGSVRQKRRLILQAVPAEQSPLCRSISLFGELNVHSVAFHNVLLPLHCNFGAVLFGDHFGQMNADCYSVAHRWHLIWCPSAFFNRRNWSFHFESIGPLQT